MRKQESKKAKKQKFSIEKWKKSFRKRQGVPGWLDPQFFFLFLLTCHAFQFFRFVT